MKLNDTMIATIMDTLRGMIRELQVEGLDELCAEVFDLPNFDKWSGSSKPILHHYGKGGLALHTMEVVMNCLSTCHVYTHVNPVVIVLAAVFHDVGKMWDYAPVYNVEGEDNPFQLDTDYSQWISTDHKDKIYHIQRSALFWMEKSSEHCVPLDLQDAVLHCILSHHGRAEWGSPVTPKTAEAWTLHLGDCLSARLNEFIPNVPLQTTGEGFSSEAGQGVGTGTVPLPSSVP